MYYKLFCLEKEDYQNIDIDFLFKIDSQSLFQNEYFPESALNKIITRDLTDQEKTKMCLYLDEFSNAINKRFYVTFNQGKIVNYPETIYFSPTYGEYCTYLLTFPDGRRYVGQCRNNEHYNYNMRWNSGEGYKENKTMYNTICCVGWENIQKELLIDGVSKEFSIALEHYVIEKLSLNNLTYGFNQNSGGVGSGKFSDKRKEQHSQTQKGIIKPQLPVIAVSENFKNVRFFQNQLAAQKYRNKTKGVILNSDGLEEVFQPNISKGKNKWILVGGFYFFTVQKKDNCIHIETQYKSENDIFIEKLTELKIVYDN